MDRAREAAIYNEAQQNLRLIDSLIKQVMSEGAGSLKTIQVRVTEGEYRANPEGGTFDFFFVSDSGFIPKGTFIQQGNLQIFIVGSAAASQNTTHLILENEILEVVQPKIGDENNFAGINTTNAISTLRLKDSGTTIVPLDTRVMIGNVTNTSWGLGYSKLAREGNDLSKAESLFHVRSNLTNVEYEIVYTLHASADFLMINVRNVSGNKTTVVSGYKIGTSADGSDIIRVGNINESVFKSPS